MTPFEHTEQKPKTISSYLQRLHSADTTLQSEFPPWKVGSWSYQSPHNVILTTFKYWSNVKLELTSRQRKRETPLPGSYKFTICKYMRFAIYARKSTESEDRQVQSLDDQIRELKNLAVREGYLVTEVIQESKSAKAPGKRPEFDRLLSEIEAGHFEGVLTWSINRLSRNPVDGGRIAYLLQTGRLVEIRTIEKTYRPEDNALLLSIENGMATAYIQDLSRNVKRGMQGKFERGWLPGKAPIGYRNDFETKEIIVDPHRFKLVREGWDMLLSGSFSIAQIVIALRERGLTYYRRGKSAQPVSRNTVYRTFRDPFYCGIIRFKDETRPGSYKPMITEAEFHEAQRLLDVRDRGTRKSKLEFPFRGSFICSKCGCAIVGERKFKSYINTGRNVEYTYYHCSGRRGCSKEAVTQDSLIRLVVNHARDLNISSRFRAWLDLSLPEAVQRLELASTESEPPELAEVAKEQKRLDALVTLRADGEIGAEEFKRSRSSILERITNLERSRAKKVRRSKTWHTKGQAAIQIFSLAGQVRECLHLRDIVAFAQKLGPIKLDPNTTRFELAPALQKIAAFEPQVLSNQSLENGSDFDSNLNWLSFWEEVLNLMDDADVQQSDSTVQTLQIKSQNTE